MPDDAALHETVRHAIAWPGDTATTGPGDQQSDWQARAVLAALEREGYRIIPPKETPWPTSRA